MSVRAKGKQQKKLVSTATVSGTVDCAYLILPFGNCCVHIFFDHLSRNSSLYLLAHTDGLIILSLRNIAGARKAIVRWGGLLRREILRRLVRLDVIQVCILA